MSARTNKFYPTRSNNVSPRCDHCRSHFNFGRASRFCCDCCDFARSIYSNCGVNRIIGIIILDMFWRVIATRNTEPGDMRWSAGRGSALRHWARTVRRPVSHTCLQTARGRPIARQTSWMSCKHPGASPRSTASCIFRARRCEYANLGRIELRREIISLWPQRCRRVFRRACRSSR